ncbi:MAG: hypothetical protein DRN03_05390 [Thermoplasmata archaeon]|nr:MAG: hypothetical protein DRN03_05390 [Thermoplasmata archaeon]
MYILFYITRFIPYFGGQINHVLMLVRKLIKRGDKVMVFSQWKGKAPRMSYLPDGLKVIRGELLPWIRSPHLPLREIGKLTQLFLDYHMLLKYSRRSDLLHIHGPGPEALLPCLPLGDYIPISAWRYIKKRVPIPVIYTFHGYPSSHILFRQRLLQILKFADCLIAINQATYLYAMRMATEIGSRAEVAMIPNAVDTELFDPDKFPEANFEGDILKILCPARVSYIKGQHILLRALNELVNDKGLDIRCTFLGEVYSPELYYFRSLQALVDEYELRKQVNFVKGVPHEKMPYYYASHHLVVLPSLEEGFPITVFEAMAMRKPVVCSRLPVFREFFKEGKHCFMFSVGDPRELAERLEYIYYHPDRAETIAQAAMEYVRRRFSTSKIIPKIIDLYFKVVSRI